MFAAKIAEKYRMNISSCLKSNAQNLRNLALQRLFMFGLLRENIQIAFGSIRTQLLRTILTILIIAIGITALVCILTVVSALESQLSSDFAAMGSNTFNINQYDFSQKFSHNDRRAPAVNPIISYPQAKSFSEHYKYPSTTTSLSFTATSKAEVRYESEKTDPEITVLGVDEHFLGNNGLKLMDGRNFSNFDIKNNASVCIVGSDFSKGLLKDVNPIDQIIAIRGAKFRVVGILEEKGSTFGNSQDLRVMIPIQVARSLFTAANINYTISVMAGKKELLEKAIDHATITMRQIRRLNPLEENNFGISRSDDLINRILSITQYLGISAWVIGVITIFGSSIALMNIMLVSVTERTREIGVRKALGATRNTIATQFFIETLVVGQLGGILGIILGILLGFAIAAAMGFGFVVPWAAILSAFAVTFLVAIFSGSYPALKASRLDPIEALRYE